jgi:saccharopine dehydrogenase-like NADP-dependent oxidoreductase
MHRLLILGGYGFFGARIARELARRADIHVLVGGRRRDKAAELCGVLNLPTDRAVEIDAQAPGLANQLRTLQVSTVIHTAGPFQGQDYVVARAAIEARSHYVDLADGRAFVAGIGALDAAAKTAGISVISGASSVPALSSAVVDQYLSHFSRLDSIRMGIGTGARAPGIATVRGIFGYCGKPIARLEEGVAATTHGWLDLRRHRFPEPVGARWLGSCDIPDLELFPKRYPTIRTITFHAGFASDLGHLVVWALAGLVKAGILRTLSGLADALSGISRWIEPLVSDKGAMFVELKGLGVDSAPLTKEWNLVVSNNHGPFIPCGASIALTDKLVAGRIPQGAMPCMGLLTVEEYLAPLKGLDIRVIPA